MHPNKYKYWFQKQLEPFLTCLGRWSSLNMTFEHIQSFEAKPIWSWQFLIFIFQARVSIALTSVPHTQTYLEENNPESWYEFWNKSSHSLELHSWPTKWHSDMVMVTPSHSSYKLFLYFLDLLFHSTIYFLLYKTFIF